MKEVCSEKTKGAESIQELFALLRLPYTLSDYSQNGTLKVQKGKCAIAGIFNYNATAAQKKAAGWSQLLTGQIPALHRPDPGFV